MTRPNVRRSCERSCQPLFEEERKKAKEELEKLNREQNMTQKERDQLQKQLEDMAEIWERLAAERRQGIISDEPDSV